MSKSEKQRWADEEEEEEVQVSMKNATFFV